MALEILDENVIKMSPGPFDVHMHPRALDAITNDGFVDLNRGSEGKAGLSAYSEAAIQSGITGGLAMPNESLRLYDIQSSEKTILRPYPISNLDRVGAMQASIEQKSVLPVGIIFGIDPREAINEELCVINYDAIRENFSDASEECIALKLYGDSTTGGYNIDIKYIPELSRLWHVYNPDKPIILHLEDQNVGIVLLAVKKMTNGKDIPIHIAHVSSRQELEAVIWAKQEGMNITCEATPHHLTLDASVREKIGGYGCMKPSLKTPDDIEFLWANVDQIDMFASDCAPHRRSDKEADNPAFGVTNHSVMLPILFGAEASGRPLTLNDIYMKTCVNPRVRFNLPIEDESWSRINLVSSSLGPRGYEEIVGPAYGHNPYLRLGHKIPMRGEVLGVKAGKSRVKKSSSGLTNELAVSYMHLIRPKNLGSFALSHD